MDSTKNSELRRSLAKRPVMSSSELEAKVEKAIMFEETLVVGLVCIFEPMRQTKDDQARRQPPNAIHT
ncbi:unnamed protein product [Linum trigynum]|uniref:Uncharacterized protein n=1 Tax=Linum trigynum TaxID=586398 RepID=A0AAV2CQX1_9ROSI